MDNDQSLPIRSKDEEGTSQPPLSRPNRTQILFEFDIQRDAQDRENPDLTYFLPLIYPPSAHPLQSLDPINIAGLLLNKCRTQHVIYLKTIETALRAAAIHTIVEDEEGMVERLAVYNIDLTIDAAEFLPENTLIAIKAPLLTVLGGGYTIRVDHPCDLILLSGLESDIPQNLASIQPEEQKSALYWKEAGNTAYSARKFSKAILAYSRALKLCTENDINLRYDLLRNRAVANRYFGCFKQGLEDGKAAVIQTTESTDEETKELNARAYKRAALAAYSLGDYDQAEALCKNELELSQDPKEVLQIIRSIEKRRKEQDTGEYDFEKMTRLCNEKRNRLDHANYLSNVEIRYAGDRGRGLFATRAISAGELILCEKALGAVFDSDPIPQEYTILHTQIQRKTLGTQSALLYMICSKAALDVDLATKFFKLFDGETVVGQLETVDGIIVVDTFKALGILLHNCIGCPTIASTVKHAQQHEHEATGYLSTGLWETVSYINHECNGNSMRSFIGDMIIIRATRDIKEDEEICMPYLVSNVDNTITQKKLQSWGFECDCNLCNAERLTTPLQRKQRNEISSKLKDLLGDQQTHFKVEALYKRAKATYDDKIFKNLPRIGLLSTGWLLCSLHLKTKAWPKLVAAAVTLLEDLGYAVQMDDRVIEIDRQHCLTMHYGIDAAMSAAYGYRKLGKGNIASQFDDFAKSVYITIFGSARGLDERPKELGLH